MTACAALVQYKPAREAWSSISDVLMGIIAFAALMRTINGTIVIRSTGNPDLFNGTESQLLLIRTLHVSSIFTVNLTIIASVLAHSFINLNKPDGFFTAFFVTQFACFLLYDGWLLARDRALQCAFFTTPKSALAAVIVLISLVFVVMCFSSSKGFRLTPLGVFEFGLLYLLQLAIVVIMTYLFTRPLLFSSGEFSLMANSKTTVLADVVRRTALGAAVHVVTSVMYIIFLVLWNYGIACEVGKGFMFHFSNIGFVAHLFLSHRDDLAFRAVASTLWSRATAFWRGTEADGPKTGAVGGVGNGGGASGAAAMKLARQPMLSMRSQVARVEQEERDELALLPRKRGEGIILSDSTMEMEGDFGGGIDLVENPVSRLSVRAAETRSK